MVCGSGLNCVNMAAQMIRLVMPTSWFCKAVWRTWTPTLAGDEGHYELPHVGAPMGQGEIVDTMVSDALWDACGFNKHMGMTTAENVCTNETYQKSTATAHHP